MGYRNSNGTTVVLQRCRLVGHNLMPNVGGKVLVFQSDVFNMHGLRKVQRRLSMGGF